MNACVIDSREISRRPARARLSLPPARALERRLALARARSGDARATHRARVELPRRSLRPRGALGGRAYSDIRTIYDARRAPAMASKTSAVWRAPPRASSRRRRRRRAARARRAVRRAPRCRPRRRTSRRARSSARASPSRAPIAGSGSSSVKRCSRAKTSSRRGVDARATHCARTRRCNAQHVALTAHSRRAVLPRRDSSLLLQ